MDFLKFKKAIDEQLKMMEPHGLFTTYAEKDDTWDLYLASFLPEDNPIYKERTEHDCQCCKQFIRSCGNVVSFIDGKMVSIWDVDVEVGYQVVANTMSDFIKGHDIQNKFLHFEPHLGTDKNLAVNPETQVVKEWNHFHHVLDQKYVCIDGTIDRNLGNYRTAKQTFKRALDEITTEAVDIVFDLANQNSLYRSDQYMYMVEEFGRHQRKYVKLNDSDKEIYCWIKNVHSSISGIRNSTIGTLLVDLSSEMELDTAVFRYNNKLDPTNYKRPTKVLTKGMIKKLEEKITDLGLNESIQRRFAHADDITINNVIYANRDAKKAMNVFDEMMGDVPVSDQNFDKVEEISIDDFISNVLPTSSSVEVMFDSKHQNNLVSLIAPVNPDAKCITKWGNNFTWSYKGEVADSMKERVKKMGGNVDGILRFSIQWNEDNDNPNDYDAHCIEPNGNLIDFYKKAEVQRSSGMLDVDIVSPGCKVAVENIIYTVERKMPEGKYQFMVHNYAHNGGRTGFSAEIEFQGKIYEFSHRKNITQGARIHVATIEHAGQGEFRIVDSLPFESRTQESWGIKTNNFHNVSMIMKSPNYWDEKSVGQKHWFFMLTECNNDLPARGFYNEFLPSELDEVRKAFEVLGSKMKTEVTDNQLSGLGFSSTKRDSIICKVSGSFNRMLKINF